MLSVGVPMISGGDEIGRTQRGNNNAYCQDNEISWTAWTGTRRASSEFLEFTQARDRASGRTIRSCGAASSSRAAASAAPRSWTSRGSTRPAPR